MSRSQPLCVFKLFWPSRAATSSAQPGEGVAAFCWAIRRFGGAFGVFSMQGSYVERGKHRESVILCILREGFAWFGVVIRREFPGLGFSPVKATEPSVAFLTRQADPSRSGYERDISGGRVLKVTLPYVATSAESISGALAPVALWERDIYVVSVLFSRLVLRACPGTCVVPSRSVSSVLDTFTPMLELYVRLRERRQLDNDLELRPESLKVPGMGPRQCGPRLWCWVVSTVVWLLLVERHLDLSSVAARLRGETSQQRQDLWEATAKIVSSAGAEGDSDCGLKLVKQEV
ncbi:hypothetical protein Taro_036920 [Colocasia esculenta]|uniref:Uncharacterized protein n=1 Tax=Colocasia esculenta TaxID=4460 RepID=A0A843WB84_COLES|nr:hypothetical protein [Colocasia esculenta]